MGLSLENSEKEFEKRFEKNRNRFDCQKLETFENYFSLDLIIFDPVAESSANPFSNIFQNFQEGVFVDFRRVPTMCKIAKKRQQKQSSRRIGASLAMEGLGLFAVTQGCCFWGGKVCITSNTCLGVVFLPLIWSHNIQSEPAGSGPIPKNQIY